MLELVTLKVDTVFLFQGYVCVCKIVGNPWHLYQMSFCAKKCGYTCTGACARGGMGDKGIRLSI